MAELYKDIVGGTYSNPGSKFDNFDLLFEKYYKLLFFTLIEEGIEFDANRNGIKAKLQLEEQGFVVYTQSDVGKWNYSSLEHQRLVSPDFALLLLNNNCLRNTIARLETRSQTPFAKSSTLDNYLIGGKLESFTINSVTRKYFEIQEEYRKERCGEPNNYDLIANKGIIRSLYSLIGRLAVYSKPYSEHQKKVAKLKELNDDIKNKKRSYDSFSKEEDELFDDSYKYSGEYEGCPEFYLGLGCYCSFIRRNALKEIYRHKINDDSSFSLYSNDPIEFSSDFELHDWWEEPIYDRDGWWISYGDNSLEFSKDNVEDVWTKVRRNSSVS